MSQDEFYSLHDLRESEDVARQCIDKLLGLPRTDIVFDRVPLEQYRLRLEILAAVYRNLSEREKPLFHLLTLTDLDWLITRCEDIYENVTQYGIERFDAWMINVDFRRQIVSRLLSVCIKEENANAETHNEQCGDLAADCRCARCTDGA